MAVIGYIPPYCSCLNKERSEETKTAKRDCAYRSFCLITTLERIDFDEWTTAAQVSSADDSIARTVKGRM